MLSREELLEIEARYHRAEWEGITLPRAVLDIGRLIGHARLVDEVIERVEMANRHTTLKLFEATRQNGMLETRLAQVTEDAAAWKAAWENMSTRLRAETAAHRETQMALEAIEAAEDRDRRGGEE